MAPYDGLDDANQTSFRPERYTPPHAVTSIGGLPRYGYSRTLGDDGYAAGLIVSSICLLVVLAVWCLVLVFFRYYTSGWLSGRLERPAAPPPKSKGRGGLSRRHSGRSRNGHDDHWDVSDDDASRTSGYESGGDLSIDSAVFWTDPLEKEELTMAVIAREQRKDRALKKAQRRRPHHYSTTTNGQLTLITALDREAKEEDGPPQFRVYIPPPLRLPLLRTYHDCLVYPDDVSNARTMIYEFFTYPGIRRDVRQYVSRYRQCMERGDNAAMVLYGDEDSDEDSLDENAPITLDVIAREQKEDQDLARMRAKSPHVFSTANNGSIQLITARGGDRKYRIVIPKTLQPKVLRTYHDCLVNPTPDNNFRKVLYVHFTWNGIHKDVKEYVAHGGLTEEMRARKGRRDRPLKRKHSQGSQSNGSRAREEVYSKDGPEGFEDSEMYLQHSGEMEEDGATHDSGCRPIGLDEIAKEQKKDKELYQLKKDEPFVFSTVRYGNTLLTTAQNFRDNKYRIVIPKRLQGRMLKTYRECLLNPTPDRNFDTLLYNHFTWNGIHDDVDYFVRHGGRLREEDNDDEDLGESRELISKDRRAKGVKDHERQDEEYLEWLERNELFERKVRRIRIAFLVCGALMIMSSMIFFEQGVQRFFSSLDEAQAGLQHTEDVIDSSLLVIGDYLDAQAGVQDLAKTVGTYDTSQYCKPDESMQEMKAQIRNSTYEIGVQLRDVAVRVELEVKGIQRDLETLGESVQNLDATAETLKAYMDFAKVVVIFVVIVALLLMATCIVDWIGMQHYIPRCFRKTFTIPLIIALVVLIWTFSSAVLVGAMAGSDFCSAPDEAAVHIISKFQEQLSPLVFMLAMYYVTGCPSDMRPEKLEILSAAASSIGGFVHSQLSNITQQADLVGLCEGTSNSTKLTTVLELTDAATHGMYELLVGVRDILACQNFNPIYTAFVYDAVCNSSVSGLSWLFFTSLAMAIFGMLMVTLRAAIHQY